MCSIIVHVGVQMWGVYSIVDILQRKFVGIVTSTVWTLETAYRLVIV